MHLYSSDMNSLRSIFITIDSVFLSTVVRPLPITQNLPSKLSTQDECSQFENLTKLSTAESANYLSWMLAGGILFRCAIGVTIQHSQDLQRISGCRYLQLTLLDP